MNVRDTVEIARNGIDMGHRVICLQLNKILEEHCKRMKIKSAKLQIKSEAWRDPDSMAQASELIKEAWHRLVILGVEVDRLETIAPWTLGRIHPSCPYFCEFGNRRLDDEQHLVLADGFINHFILRFYEEQIKWKVTDWKRMVITPVEDHRKLWEKSLELISKWSSGEIIVLDVVLTDNDVGLLEKMFEMGLNSHSVASRQDILTQAKWKSSGIRAFDRLKKAGFVRSRKGLGFYLTEKGLAKAKSLTARN